MAEKRDGFCLQCRYREMGNYCQRCGSHLVDILSWDMECPKCGRFIFPWYYYCDECGERITQDSIILYLEKERKNAKV